MEGIDNIPDIPTDYSIGTYLVVFDDMLKEPDRDNKIQKHFKMGRKSCYIIIIVSRNESVVVLALIVIDPTYISFT